MRVNPLRADMFEKKKTRWQFLQFITLYMAQVMEFLPDEEKWPMYPTILWLMMTYQLKGPGHQQSMHTNFNRYIPSAPVVLMPPVWTALITSPPIIETSECWFSMVATRAETTWCGCFQLIALPKKIGFAASMEYQATPYLTSLPRKRSQVVLPKMPYATFSHFYMPVLRLWYGVVRMPGCLSVRLLC